MNVRGKLLPLTAAGVAVIVLVLAAVAARSWLVEEYHLARLRNADNEEKRQIARWLAENGTTRSMPDLFAILAKMPSGLPFAHEIELFEFSSDRSRVTVRAWGSEALTGTVTTSSSDTTVQVWDANTGELLGGFGTQHLFVPCEDALVKISERERRRCVKSLSRVLLHEAAGCRRLAAILLGKLGPHARDAILHLEASTEDPDERVRAAAAEALKEVVGEAEGHRPL